MGVLHSFSIKDIFYDKMDLRLFNFRVTKSPNEIIVVWVVSAKNTLHSCYGYSPNQLVFGKKINFPSMLFDNSPALKGQTSSEIIAYHLNATHAARAAFVQSEANEKVRKVIRKKRGLHLRF